MEREKMSRMTHDFAHSMNESAARDKSLCVQVKEQRNRDGKMGLE